MAKPSAYKGRNGTGAIRCDYRRKNYLFIEIIFIYGKNEKKFEEGGNFFQYQQPLISVPPHAIT
jgi:hypothetical protein